MWIMVEVFATSGLLQHLQVPKWFKTFFSEKLWITVDLLSIPTGSENVMDVISC